MDTAKLLWSTRYLVLSVPPIRVQIVADIMALPRVLEKIITADGYVVYDKAFRSGRRERLSDGKGDCDQEVRMQRRLSTNTCMKPHPSCAPALAMLNVDSAVEQVGPMEDDAEPCS
jgi:hypothetical protein